MRLSLLFSIFLFAQLSFASSAQVKITLSPAGGFVAKTQELKGEAILKDGKVTAENIVVNLTNLKTGVSLRDKHTKKHLETEKYPEAKLKLGSGEGGKGKGVILIKGIEKEISGKYAIKDGELKAKFKLKLSDFKIEDINYMGVGVEDEVEVLVELPVKNK